MSLPDPHLWLTVLADCCDNLLLLAAALGVSERQPFRCSRKSIFTPNGGFLLPVIGLSCFATQAKMTPFLSLGLAGVLGPHLMLSLSRPSAFVPLPTRGHTMQLSSVSVLVHDVPPELPADVLF